MTTFDLVGHSYAVPYGVTTEKGAMQLLAAHLGAELHNHAVAGAVLYYSKVSGGYATVANKLVRTSAALARAADFGGVWYDGNDIFCMDATFGATSQNHLKSVGRFAISRMCAGKIFDDEDASIAYSGFSKSTELGEGKVTGKYTHYTTTNGSTVTIDLTKAFPEGFPGGDVAVYLNGLNAAGATWTFKVDGLATGGELSTLFSYPAPVGEAYSMFCERLTGVPPGAEKIVCTANSIKTFAAFDSWAVEAPTPPTVIVPGQFKLNEYGTGETHNPTDADIEALEKLIKEACEEFGSHVKFVSLSSMDHTTNVQADQVHPTALGHEEIFDLMVAALEEGEEVIGAHMDFGFLRDSQRRLIVTPGAEGRMSQGFLRDAEGSLAVALGGEGTMDYGFVRDEGRRLVVVEGAIDHVDQGFPRDSAGRLVVTGEGADHFDQGFLRDEDGRLVVVGL